VREIIWNDDYLGNRVAFKTKWMRHSECKTHNRLTGKMKPANYCLPRNENDSKRLAQQGLCEPLVSEELAEKARAFLTQYREAHSYRRKHPTTPEGEPLPERLLAGGFMLCGHCGAHMIGVSGGANKWYERRYQCRRHRIFTDGLNNTDCPGGSVSITGDVFEEVVWWMVVKILTDGKTLPGAVAKLRAQADTRMEARAKKRKALQDAIARCEETLAVNNRLMQASARQEERFTETRQFAMWRLEVQQAEADIIGHEKDLVRLDTDDESMERHLPVLDRLASQHHNEAIVALFKLDIEGRRQMLREMNLRVYVWNKGHNPRWGIRIGPPDSPLVVTAQKAPTAALAKTGPTIPLMSKKIEYQHYIRHQIAGLVSKLIVTYGAEPKVSTDAEEKVDADQIPSENS
jgi:Recombinase zinc beta ribbon domain